MRKTPRNGSNKRLKIYCVLLAVLIALAVIDGSLLLANILSERTAHVAPSYERVDIEATIAKAGYTEEDYDLLFRQTGLSKNGIERLKTKYPLQAEFKSAVLGFQSALFADYKIVHETVSPVTSRDCLAVADGASSSDGETVRAPLVPVELGDVLVSSVCHSLGWRHGHSALVVDALNMSVLESVTVGVNSIVTRGGTNWFRESANFMVLRLKDEYRDTVSPADVAKQALDNLSNVPYSLTVGIFHKKDQGIQPQYTHCSHLVWQAYKNFGIDLDSNGGLIVSSRDIARSKYFEVVQVFGFDPVKLW